MNRKNRTNKNRKIELIWGRRRRIEKIFNFNEFPLDSKERGDRKGKNKITVLSIARAAGNWLKIGDERGGSGNRKTKKNLSTNNFMEMENRNCRSEHHFHVKNKWNDGEIDLKKMDRWRMFWIRAKIERILPATLSGINRNSRAGINGIIGNCIPIRRNSYIRIRGKVFLNTSVSSF